MIQLKKVNCETKKPDFFPEKVNLDVKNSEIESLLLGAQNQPEDKSFVDSAANDEMSLVG